MGKQAGFNRELGQRKASKVHDMASIGQSASYNGAKKSQVTNRNNLLLKNKLFRWRTGPEKGK